MTIVVDASVAAKWFIREVGREEALKVLDAAERHAPDLIVAEIANVACKKAIQGEVTHDQARFICASVRHYFSVLHSGEALVSRAIGIALQLGHPIYDCFYLACADRIGSRLVTVDRRLLASISDTEFTSLAVDVSDF